MTTSISQGQTAVTHTAAVAIYDAAGKAGPIYVHVRNDGDDPVYIGDADVTAADGLRIAPSTTHPVAVVLKREDALYARCSLSEATTVHVLATQMRRG